MGKQMLSTKPTAPAGSLPKSERPSLVPVGTTVMTQSYYQIIIITFESMKDIGPGEYAPPPAACEVQIESSKTTCPTLKVILTLINSLTLSNSLTHARAQFGTGYRRGGGLVKPTLLEPSPGPAAYTLPGGISTRSKGSPFRDAPAATISGRNKFGSPW